MAINGKRKRTLKRSPRTSGYATDCISIMPDGTSKVFTPKQRDARRVRVVELPDGTLITRISDL